jgi:D-threo-aldose 1-dehydrogenase
MQLKKQGKVKAVGVGSKDWKTIREIAAAVDLDWVMLACSLTIYTHPPELLAFIAELHQRNIGIVNSAVFNAGFLTGGAFFDYRKLDVNKAEDKPYFVWREKFFALCKQFAVKPAVACVQFGLTPPGIASIALNTSKPDRVQQNVALVQTAVPAKFWTACKDDGLISKDYPYAG